MIPEGGGLVAFEGYGDGVSGNASLPTTRAGLRPAPTTAELVFKLGDGL